MTTRKPYLSPNPVPIDAPVTVNRLDATWRYQVVMEHAGYLHIDAPDLNALALTLVEALYDNGDLSMDVAGRLNTMSMTVLQDPREALEAAMMEAGADL